MEDGGTTASSEGVSEGRVTQPTPVRAQGCPGADVRAVWGSVCYGENGEFSGNWFQGLKKKMQQSRLRVRMFFGLFLITGTVPRRTVT